MATTVCLKCQKQVPSAPGLCLVCGQVFDSATIRKQVAATENDYPLPIVPNGGSITITWSADSFEQLRAA